MNDFANGALKLGGLIVVGLLVWIFVVHPNKHTFTGEDAPAKRKVHITTKVPKVVVRGSVTTPKIYSKGYKNCLTAPDGDPFCCAKPRIPKVKWRGIRGGSQWKTFCRLPRSR